jgi:hypothetical protein
LSAATISFSAAAPLFLVQRPRPLAGGIEIGLVAADDPLAHFTAAVLDAAIAADDAELGTQLEIAHFALAIDEERVATRGLLGRRLAGDNALLDAPEFRVAVPAVERLAVEERLKPGLVIGCDCGADHKQRRCQKARQQ